MGSGLAQFEDGQIAERTDLIRTDQEVLCQIVPTGCESKGIVDETRTVSGQIDDEHFFDNVWPPLQNLRITWETSLVWQPCCHLW